MSPAKPVYVYVAGAYSEGLFDENVARVVDVADRLALLGFVPFVPHTMGFLWAVRHQHPAAFWYDLGNAWLSKCDALYRVPGSSKGSDDEVVLAGRLGIPVFHDYDAICAWSNHQEKPTLESLIFKPRPPWEKYNQTPLRTHTENTPHA